MIINDFGKVLQSFGSKLNLITAFSRSTLILIWYGNAASMVNQISCDSTKTSDSSFQQLTSDAVIEVGVAKYSYFIILM